MCVDVHTPHSTTCGNSFFLPCGSWGIDSSSGSTLKCLYLLGHHYLTLKIFIFRGRNSLVMSSHECLAVATVSQPHFDPEHFSVTIPNISRAPYSRCPFVFSSFHWQVLSSGCFIHVVIWIQLTAFHYSPIPWRRAVFCYSLSLWADCFCWLLWIAVFWAFVCWRADKLLFSECFCRSGMARTKFPWCLMLADYETAPVTVPPAVYMGSGFSMCLPTAAIISEFYHLDFLRLCILLFCLGPPMWVTDLTRDT